MKKLSFIKLGGSLITDKSKPFTPKMQTIKRLSADISELIRKYDGKIILGHGGGSFPHTPAAKYKTHLGNINKNSLKGFSETEDAAVRINRLVMQCLLEKKINSAPFSAMSFVYSSDVFVKPIIKALEIGIMPVVYGDAVLDRDRGFKILSTEEIFSLLIEKIGTIYDIDKVVMLGDTDGVYDQKGIVVENISSRNWNKVKDAISGSKSTDVTGGMVHKVEESLKLVRQKDIETTIANGNIKGILAKVFEDRKYRGTRIIN